MMEYFTRFSRLLGAFLAFTLIFVGIVIGLAFVSVEIVHLLGIDGRGVVQMLEENRAPWQVVAIHVGLIVVVFAAIAAWVDP